MKFTGERYIPFDGDSAEEIGYEHLHRYSSCTIIVQNKTVLDIACGEGYGSAILAKHAKSVAGVDIDNECIILAGEKYSIANGNLQFKAGSVDSIPYTDNSFDVVISFETIEHLTEDVQNSFIKEIKRVLKPGGILVMSTPDKRNYSDRYNHVNVFHLHEFYKDEFAEFIKQNFKYFSLFEQGFEVVSIISNTASEKSNSINIHNLYNADYVDVQRKYIVTIASDENFSDEMLSFASIVPRVDKDYLSLMDRLIAMNTEIENLGNWGHTLNKSLEDAQLKIDNGNKIIQVQTESILKFSNEKIEKNNLEIEIDELKQRLIETEHKCKQFEAAKLFVDTELTRKDLQIQTFTEQVNFLKADIESGKVKESLLENEIQNLSQKFIQLQDSEKNRSVQNNLLAKSLEEKESNLASTISIVHKLESEITGFTKKIERQDQLLIRQSATIQTLVENKNKAAGDNLSLQEKIREKAFLVDELNENLHRLYQETNTTKERLSEIFSSDGWRLLNKYYKVKGRVLPEGSNRYNLLKKIFNKIRFKSSINTTLEYPDNALPKQNGKLIEKANLILDKLELPFFEYPSVSIIIPVYNAWEMNHQCIESIIRNTHGIAYEVILADDCSTDSTIICKENIKNVVHIRNEKNLGFLNNCNNAAKSARGEYILFLNNDTKVSPNWLSPLVGLIEKDSTIGMVGSKLIYPDGRLQEAGGIVWNDSSAWNYGHHQNPDFPEFNYVKEVDYISGACIMIPKKIWEKAHGFDERYSPAYCEDSDLAFTLRSMGYKTMYQPLSEVIHYEGYSHGTDKTIEESTTSIKLFQKVNNQKLLEKWKAVLSKDHFPNAQNVFWARDKSTNKKTVLVIDHYVPHFDKDAGSKTTFQYLELFTSLGLNVKFIGDNFFKHEPYTTVLQQMGIEVLYGAWYRDNWQQWIKDNSNYIDYVYLNRPHISIKYIDFIREFTKATILYYGHDLHFVREEMQYKIEKDSQLLESAARWKNTEMYLFKNTDIILTPSEDEKNIISSLSPTFHVQSILPYFFKKTATPITNFTERNNILFVGGFSHLPNLDAVEWFCREIWPLVVSRIPSVKFIVVGSNPPESVKNLQSEHVEIKGFVSEQELQSIYEQAKVVVIPLRYGAGVKGKTVEAMHWGLPIVSTSFGLEGLPGDYTDFINPVDKAQEFADRLISLYHNLEELENTSKKEASYINQYFTYNAAALKMKQMLKLIPQ